MPRFSGALMVVAMLIVGVGFAYAFLTYGPFSLRARYNEDVARILLSGPPDPPITAADLEHLPPPVQRYLRVSGVVGQPRVRNFFARMHGRFRSSPGDAWMPFTAEQHDAFECCRGASRFFYMTATRWMVPMQAYHRFTDGSASMRVKVAGAATVMSFEGAEMTQTETVTIFNDLCVMAPAALVNAPVVWERVADNRATAAYTNAGVTIRADLVFDAAGRLVDFVSDDRMKAAEDGSTLLPSRWSTPLQGRKTFGAVTLAAGGDARWHSDSGDFVYIELAIDDVVYNVPTRPTRPSRP